MTTVPSRTPYGTSGSSPSNDEEDRGRRLDGVSVVRVGDFRRLSANPRNWVTEDPDPLYTSLVLPISCIFLSPLYLKRTPSSPP